MLGAGRQHALAPRRGIQCSRLPPASRQLASLPALTFQGWGGTGRSPPPPAALAGLGRGTQTVARLPSPLRALPPSGHPEAKAWTRIEHKTGAAGGV